MKERKPKIKGLGKSQSRAYYQQILGKGDMLQVGRTQRRGKFKIKREWYTKTTLG